MLPDALVEPVMQTWLEESEKTAGERVNYGRANCRKQEV
jgi:hypothetical protein